MDLFLLYPAMSHLDRKTDKDKKINNGIVNEQM